MEIAKNSRARFEYEVLEDIEAGIVLVGSEVKSLRLKKVTLTDAYAVFKGSELYLINMRIEPYNQGSHFNPDPVRPRKLLLKSRELVRLKGKMAEKGLAMVPLKMYFKNNRIVKVLLGLVRGKKLHDKRQAMKEKDMDREARRDLKNYR